MRAMPTIMLITACGLSACGEEVKVILDKELQHKNGLSVTRPVSFDDAKTATGFVFSESGGLRTPRSISVEKAELSPELPNARERRLGEAIARYTVNELGVGSGGTEYELKAVKAAGSYWVVLTERSQVEGHEPDFLVGWAILEGARLP